MPHADDAVERALRACAAALIGEIAHELNNRLATMRETVGLLEDLARAGKAGAAGTARAHAALDDQVGRALNSVRLLGGLGGALGAPGGSFDAGAALGELLAASERWARRLSLTVSREIPARPAPALGDPALFLCLAHRLLLRCAGGLRAGGSILVRVEGRKAGVAVRLAPSGPRDQAAALADYDEDIDRALAVRLGAGLVFEGGGAATIMLAAPL